MKKQQQETSDSSSTKSEGARGANDAATADKDDQQRQASFTSENKGPQCKDQVPNEETSDFSRRNNKSGRPDFKDQVGSARSVALPDFKDQVRDRTAKSVQEPEPSQEPGDSNTSQQDPERTFLAEAQVVGNARSIYTAEAVRGIFVDRRSVIISIVMVVVVVAAAIIGILFGLDVVGDSSSSMAPTTPSPSPEATTPAPTMVSPEAKELLDYINSVTFLERPIQYPPPSDSNSEELALQWLIETDPLQQSLESNRTQIRERYALAAFGRRTNADVAWIDNKNWFSEESVCRWSGVFCDTNADTDIVIGLSFFESNNLIGEISPDIALLSSLRFMNLPRNSQLEGTLPPSLGSLNMRNFDISSCNLSGSLPSVFGQWQSLSLFKIASNHFSSTLPQSIESWTDLSRFRIEFNDFTGTLPDLGNWRDLYQFDISGNRFNTTLPSSIESWPSMLTIFRASNNQLSGSLPENISRWLDLEVFDVHDNLLTGQLPTSLGNWQLDRFDTSNNDFSGLLPESLRQWTAITYFDIDFNQFSGPLPDGLEDWSLLQTFYARGNNLSGTLPLSISAETWKDIIVFDVSSNSLHGEIPAALLDWWTPDAFVQVNLQGNSFTGPFATELCRSGAYDAAFGIPYSVDCDSVECPCCFNCVAHEGCYGSTPYRLTELCDPESHFCDLHEIVSGEQCETDGKYRKGECVLVPLQCDDVCGPVCGCDDITYRNDCLRIQAGVWKKGTWPCHYPWDC